MGDQPLEDCGRRQPMLAIAADLLQYLTTHGIGLI